MNHPPVLMKSIQQKDNYTVAIGWSDNTINDYRLSDLQRKCPCAKCCDEITGERRVAASSIADDVRAVRMTNVGRYAMRIQFTSGCSTGIYSFAMLRELAKGKVI